MADRTWTGRLLLRGEEQGLSRTAQQAENAIGGIANQLKRFGQLAAIAGATTLFAGSVNKIREFEKSISDLSAITGAAGKDLEFLSDASKRIGQTTTLTASQAAEAFKLIASAKPDLLGNVEALNATTEAAVTLAEAAGLDLPTAATALGESLNQFGAGAEEASKFINVLAAGAKFGSSEINQTSEALKNAGTVAKLAGLSFEETNAAIQALAAAGIKGSDAGTKLRSVLIKLQVQANDNFNPAVVGINEALDNLGEANLSVTEKVELFGERSVATADVLLDQRDVLDLVEEQVTDTSEAYDQASTRVDNLDGDLKRLGSAFEAFQLDLVNNQLPALRGVTQSLTDILNAMTAVSSADGAPKAAEEFSLFGGILKTVATAGNVFKNVLDAIADVLGFVGRAIVGALSGDFELISLGFEELKDDIEDEFIDIGDFAANTFNPELAAEVKANTDAFFKEPLVTSAKEAVEETAKVVATAGQEAAIKDAERAAETERREAEKRERLLQGFVDGLRTEQEILVENRELRLAEISLLENEQIFLEQEAREKRLIVEEEFQRRKLEIEMRGATALQKFEQLTSRNKTKFVLAEGVRLTQGVAQNSKTMFRINKIAAIASATVNTAEAVTTTLKAYPYPINVGLAALTAAAGFAQVNAIRSAQFSGGGGGTTPSAAGSVPTLNNQPVGGIPEIPFGGGVGGPNGGQVITVNIDGLPEGGLLTTDATRNLISSINEALGDGVTINVDGAG